MPAPQDRMLDLQAQQAHRAPASREILSSWGDAGLERRFGPADRVKAAAAATELLYIH